MRRKSIAQQQIQASHWDPNEVVVIRSLTTEDEEAIANGLTELSKDGQMHIHAGRSKRLTLLRAIVSWTLTDEAGRPLPLNETSIRNLDAADSQFILDAIHAFNKPMDAAEKKGSSTNATPGTVAVAASSQTQ
jgi:hypothetical protein